MHLRSPFPVATRRPSRGNGPCLVAGYLFTPCFGNSFSLGPLQPGQMYVGPSLQQVNVESCECGTVLYSLMCACGACQGGTWISWSNYIPNCTAGTLDTPYPYPIPDGTYVPYWALLNVTAEGIWNLAESRAVGDTPETGPGMKIINDIPASSNLPSSPTASTNSPTTSTQSPTATSSSSSGSGGSSNLGSIAGGVAGGLVAVSAAALILFFFLKRRRPQQSPPIAAVYGGTQQPPMDEVWPQPTDGGAFVTPSLPETRALPMRLYDPDDPTTFPGYQGPDPVPKAHTQVPAVSNTGSTLVNMQTSQPPGYHGFPTV
ncbi:hypothetical protein BGW80DRAFT_1396314 [Lactifluus volemus]|nr:hypothetical protein BGW80DRAFT_1396314 [Lactifluus volemus]